MVFSVSCRTGTRKRKSENQQLAHKRIDSNRQFKIKSVHSPAYASESAFFGRWHPKMEQDQNNLIEDSEQEKTALPSLPVQKHAPLPVSSSLLPSIKDMLFNPSSTFISGNRQFTNQLPPLQYILRPEEAMYTPLSLPIDRPFFNSNTRK